MLEGTADTFVYEYDDDGTPYEETEKEKEERMERRRRRDRFRRRKWYNLAEEVDYGNAVEFVVRRKMYVVIMVMVGLGLIV